MNNARMLVATARLVASRRWPHINLLATAWPCRECRGLSTMAVNDDWCLLYDPEFVQRTNVDHLASVIQHEALHLMLGHLERGAAYKNTELWQVWNVACDLAVNSILGVDGFPLPAGALNARGFNLPSGMHAEWYFDALQKQLQVKPNMLDNAKTGQNACEQHGKPEPNEDGTPADREGVPKYDRARYVGAAMEQLRRAVADGRGSQSGRHVIDHVSSTSRFDRISHLLRKYLSKASCNASSGVAKRSYQFVNRRNQDQSILLPGRKIVNVDVCVMVDTSGSMASHFPFAASVIDGAVKKLRLRNGLRVICGDTQIEFDQRVTSLSDVAFRGLGGTNMAAMLDEVRNDKPDVCLLVTDGDTPWPDRCDFPVVVLLTQPCRNVPSWMDVVKTYE